MPELWILQGPLLISDILQLLPFLYSLWPDACPPGKLAPGVLAGAVIVSAIYLGAIE